MKKLTAVLTCLVMFVSLFTGFTSVAVKSTKEVHLKIFIPQPRFRDQYTSYFDQFAKKYEKEKNVKVTYDLEMPDANNQSQILKTRLASNEDLDIFAIHAVNDVPTYNKAGYLEDLSDQPFVKKLLPSIKPSVTINKKVLSLPLESLEWGILYNKKIFKQLGLTPPTTLTEMKAVVKKLNAAKITPFLLSYKDSWIAQLFLPLIVGGQVNTTQKHFLDNMNKGTGSFAQLKGFFDIIDLVNANGTSKALDLGGDNGCAAFAQGKAAMWVQGPWYAESILKVDKNFEFGVAPLPINDNPNASLINLSVSTTLCVSKFSKNKEVAKALLNYVLDDKDSNAFYQSLAFNPVATVHTFKPYSWVADAMVYVKAGKSCSDPIMPPAVKDEVGKVLQTYYLKVSSQNDVIKDLDKTWKNSLNFNK